MGELIRQIGGYSFQCVPLSEADFSNRAAIYVMLCVSEEGISTVLDVGQSGEAGSRLDDLPRLDCWLKECPFDNIWVCVHPMPTDRYTIEERQEVESQLRQRYEPLCPCPPYFG